MQAFFQKDHTHKSRPEISFRSALAHRSLSRKHFPFYKNHLTMRSATEVLLILEKPQNIDLFFFKSSTCCFFTVVSTAAFDVHMICVAFIIRIINTLIRLTVNADRPAGMGNSACERPHIASVFEALTTGVILAAGMSAGHHDIPLAAAPVIVVGTIFHGTT